MAGHVRPWSGPGAWSFPGCPPHDKRANPAAAELRPGRPDNGDRGVLYDRVG